MLQKQIFEQINQQLTTLLQNSPMQDMEKNIKALVLAVFNKLDLVTREEFDTQSKVLLATREKLERLEQLLQDLEIKSK